MVISAFGQCVLCLALIAPSADKLSEHPAVELRYAGTLSRVGRGGAEQPLKRFTLFAIVTQQESGRRLAYLTDERGGGGWAWPERFGAFDLTAKNAPANGATIRVLAEHDALPHPLTLRQPLFEHADKLGDDGEDDWVAGQSSYEVVRELKLKDRDCWLIQVSTNNGRKQRLWVSKDDGTLLVAAEQQVFMGRGDEFQLKLELESFKPIDAAALAKQQRPLQSLLDLKATLNRPDSETKPELSTEQIAAAQNVIGSLEKDADGTPFATLAAVISRDVKAQSQRADDIESLAKKSLGQAAAAFELSGLDKNVVSSKDFAGKTIVLHFWDYEGEPLTEPYGQVGYLDFLINKRRRFGIEVYGIAVNEAFSSPEKTAGVLRSVRKLREFMNLSYPILTDDGTVLAKFGDPRKLGAKLPLWVVIDPQGKIVHYHAGFFAIKADEGLRQLDETVMRANAKK